MNRQHHTDANSTRHETSELVVVTGASTGIGRATAKRLAADGFHVLAGVRRQADADRLAAPGIEPVILDITDEAHVAALAERVARDRDRPLRALVNNAGIAVNAPVETVALPEWRRQFDVGVFGQIAVTQALLPALLAHGGRVVNIGSVGGKVAMPGFGPYSGAKFAMEAVSDALRREVEEFGVEVVVVTPGAVRTSMNESGVATAKRLAGTMTPDQHARYDKLTDAFLAQIEAFDKDGVEPERAAAVVARAITARKPRTRYQVGRDAAVIVRVARLVPDRLLDRMLRRRMKLG
ncbi:SDR family NAD(P)-dependent oxidoreductase [Umezawaea tangerina]|uniref:NADP-dependent 3-hydroxy acid dehydrogenase YdfG n=1 Tax=Umezawaea tangerina TaxID=84725 RepID=A0A2T0T1V4_9PSEU|nr:SDR family NAD(P)-dependent oxidoreductase [Umezawaea tangerina]PRY39655.1 NADP-dependent 3-hydroxy acid dehydrogenase YdfG [Umezawaea tangerina]